MKRRLPNWDAEKKSVPQSNVVISSSTLNTLNTISNPKNNHENIISGSATIIGPAVISSNSETSRLSPENCTITTLPLQHSSNKSFNEKSAITNQCERHAKSTVKNIGLTSRSSCYFGSSCRAFK